MITSWWQDSGGPGGIVPNLKEPVENVLLIIDRQPKITNLSISTVGDQLLRELGHSGVQVVQEHVDDRGSLPFR